MDDLTREKLEIDAFYDMVEKDIAKEKEEQGYVKCECCNMWVEDTTNGVCESCIDDLTNSMTLEDTIEYAKHCNKDDFFILMTEYIFDKETAANTLAEMAIAIKFLYKEKYKKQIKEFIDNDIYHFLDYLKKKGEI